MRVRDCDQAMRSGFNSLRHAASLDEFLSAEELSKIRPRSADTDTTPMFPLRSTEMDERLEMHVSAGHYRKERRPIDGIIFAKNLLHCGRRTGRNGARIFAGARRNQGPDFGETR